MTKLFFSCRVHNALGAGYHLTVVYKRENTLGVPGQNPKLHMNILDFLRKFCSDTVVQSAVGLEATFVLNGDNRSR